MWRRHLLFWCLMFTGTMTFAAFFLPFPTKNDRFASGTIPPASTSEIQEVSRRIDEHLRETWKKSGTQPADPASEFAVVRRLSLALTGTIPSLEELRVLEMRPKNRRVEWWTDYLLADKRTWDYLSERLARAVVGTSDGPFILYRRRRFVYWISEQLASGRSYDNLVREIVTSKGVWTEKPAVNFFTAAIKPDSQEDPNESVLTTRLSRAFLGIRMDCAECHDHPFEHWLQKDFHGLAAYFGPVERSNVGIRDGNKPYVLEDRKTLAKNTIEPRVPYLSELLPLKDNSRYDLAAWLTHPKNKPFSRSIANRMWSLLFGEPLMAPFDDLPISPEELATKEANGNAKLDGNYASPENDLRKVPHLVEILAEDFSSHGFDLRRLIRVIVATEAFRLDSLDDSSEKESGKKALSLASTPSAAGNSPAPPQPAGAVNAGSFTAGSTIAGTGSSLTEIPVAEGSQASAEDSASTEANVPPNWSRFPMSRLRPEQVAGSLTQALSFTTIDAQSSFVARLSSLLDGNQFVQRFGDVGENEMESQAGTIPQRLLMMNGNLVSQQFSSGSFLNVAGRIGFLANDNAQALEIAYLMVLSRRPTSDESRYFLQRMEEDRNTPRGRKLEDVLWALVNSTEFSWNH